MKARKVTAYGFLILGLLVCGSFVLHAKSSGSRQDAISETSGGEKKINHSQTLQGKVGGNSTEVDDSISEAKASTISASRPNGSTTIPDTTSTTTSSVSPTNATTPITHGSWFMIPGDIKWNHKTYHLDANKRNVPIGKNIGTGEDLQIIPETYPIYEIPGIVSSEAIAIDVHQVYFEAFLEK